jgi:hypothetical protein
MARHNAMEFEAHEYVSIFPELSDEHLADLAQDIREQGLRDQDNAVPAQARCQHSPDRDGSFKPEGMASPSACRASSEASHAGAKAGQDLSSERLPARGTTTDTTKERFSGQSRPI